MFGKSKKIIIIKDIHSNLFEEAILVLKEDNEQEKEKAKKLWADNNLKGKNDFILKEAEAIINTYIKENKGIFTTSKDSKGNAVRRKINDSRFMKNLIINSALFGSIAAVVFLLIKLL